MSNMAKQNPSTYGYAKHPKSGETYAVERDDAGTIIRAVGPLHWADAEKIEPGEFILNASSDDESLTDGEWLQNEICRLA